ncbi:metal-sensitive transcriptional regulator [Candidatus Woesebacteria bacterium]|nr:metal-sensitive transcriptional regulator [Candidatus Woesebacteria bacterium]
MKTDKVLTQLKRIRGQLDGIIRMYEDERGCVDIVRQVIAARSSLGRVSRDLLSSEATRCSKERKAEELNDILKEVFRY